MTVTQCWLRCAEGTKGKRTGEDWHCAIESEGIFWVAVSNIFYFHPYLGKWSNLTNIFQMGWNHQPVLYWHLAQWNFRFECLTAMRYPIYSNPTLTMCLECKGIARCSAKVHNQLHHSVSSWVLFALWYRYYHISSCIGTPPCPTFLQHETFGDCGQKEHLELCFTWECFTGVFHCFSICHTFTWCSLCTLPWMLPGEGRPAEPIGSFGGDVSILFPQFATLEVK